MERLQYINRPAPLEEFSDYDAYWQSRIDDGLTERELDRFVTIAGLIEDDASVLDIGCGDCSFQRYLSKTKPACHSLGLDASLKAVELAKAQHINAQLIDHDKSLKEQISGKWDIVTLMEVIEHVVDAEDLMRQILELKPNRVFVSIPNVGCLKHRLRLMFGGRFPITSIYYHMKEHVRFWTVKDFKQWTESVGFNVASVHGQFDHGDSIVKWFVKNHPALFADRVIYELQKNDK